MLFSMKGTDGMNRKELAAYIDHTNLKAFVNEADMKKLCEEAKDFGCAMVAVNSGQVRRCKKYLKGTNVHVGAAIGFPLGQQTVETKVFETLNAIYNDADEIDYVINITELKNKNYVYVEDEMRRICDLCKSKNVICKVIFENCYLEKEEIEKLCEIALKVKPDYIKTSTGFGTSGAKLEDVRLMKSIVKDDIKVKAAGGIRTLEETLAFIEAGAERIGTSNSLSILNELEPITVG